ncbi:RES domain-containing protein [Mesorhizobium huakuii]|uniref:RES domain-containing protein n=1 Tax=Mesorhizobium huakuii TaxID=28104 RepID=A0ABZ0W2C5_9HYPH|nr:RES domain-containing protein [Mesorhizobium huakuii]WQC02720.1 RES domain-containing protein [Mesorhizobium huakuii]
MAGGRFNRTGIEALYRSRSTQTALDEYKQGALAAYVVAWDGSWNEWDFALAPSRSHRQENPAVVEA